uniref:glucan endo-1,3-beta-D-glucosidase n=1 Tax=Pithovirus LCPAC101 TaxID=2506586 RepID=A0A481Z3N1_9VIRU|nr:MAG: glycosyl hydrolase family 81 [Pithovirus LCPAC101]
MSSYPNFDPPSNYPRPDEQNIDLNLPIPTNSWNQESIVNNIADPDRVANGTPWYLKPNYANIRVGLSYGSVQDITTALDYGNIILQEAPPNRIDIGIEDALKLTTVDVTDLSTRLIYTNNQTTIADCTFVRGSPTVNFNTFESSVVFNFLSGLIALDRIEETDTYFLDSVLPAASVINAPLFQNLEDNNQFISKDLSFYKGVNPIPGEEIEVIYGVIDGNNVITAKYNQDGEKFNLVMPINNPSNASNDSIFPDEIYNLNLQIGDVENGFVLTNKLTGEVDKIIVNTETKLVTISKIIQERHRWIIYTDAGLLIFDQGTSTLRTNKFTGHFRIAYGGQLINNQTEINFFGHIFTSESLVLADAFKLSIIGHGIVTNIQEIISNSLIGWSYDLLYNNTGVLFIPPHLVSDGFELEGIELYQSTDECECTNNEISWPSVTYGRLKLYRILTGRVKIITTQIHIEDFQQVNNLLPNNQSRELMKQLIEFDINTSLKQLTVVTDNLEILARTDLNPYNFGLIIAKAARVLNLATLLQIELDLSPNINNFLLEVIREILTTWLNGTNNDQGEITYQLQRDPVWRGIIVPADSLNLTDINSPTSYGNSFYNDHHFQYGYIIYALAVLENLDFGLHSEYPANTLALVQDYCNPNFDTFTRVRHKDFLFGHSWATGVPGVPTNIPGVEGAGPVNRQEESSGEAINSYFAAYLFGKNIRDNNLRTVAGLSMYLEIFSSRFYFLYDSPDSDIGNLSNTGSIGIIQTEGKSYTLNFPTQPPTFPGRSLGIYGIQSLPFTEITGNYLPNDFINPFNMPVSRFSNRMSQHGMSTEIVKSILNGTYIADPLQQGPNNNIPYSLTQDGYFWGNIAMMILAFSKSAASNTEIQELFSIIIDKLNSDPDQTILKDFDSFSNTYYILLRLRGVDITPVINMSNIKYSSFKHQCIYNKKVKINKKMHIKNDDIESNSLTSNLDITISSSSNSKLEHINNKYKYKCYELYGELFVSKSRCAMLKIYYGNKRIIIHKDKLPYILTDKMLSESQIAKFIIIYESNKNIKLLKSKLDKYLKDDRYYKYMKKYNK